AIVTILMLLNSLNSCVNPWIYLLFNRNLMNAPQASGVPLSSQECWCRSGRERNRSRGYHTGNRSQRDGHSAALVTATCRF
ncbi:hypothetical protein MRX96_053890, partial [Rhipicephalus microplus]